MEPEVFISYNHMAEGAGLWSKIIGTAQIVLGVRWPLADSQETISPLVCDHVCWKQKLLDDLTISVEPVGGQNCVQFTCLSVVYPSYS